MFAFRNEDNNKGNAVSILFAAQIDNKKQMYYSSLE